MPSLRVAFIKANWHADIVSQAESGFRQELDSQQVEYTVDSWDVPGAFEMPLLAQRLAKSGSYDAIVCAALVVDGGIYRHDFVAQAVVSGLMQAQLATEVPMFSVSLTPHNFQPAAEFIDFYRGHFVKKGREAAKAVLQIHRLPQPKA
ncbi:6,7-dimethyl-8-ribityllumazine synthase [Raoultella terrigena]|jgi:6,7-dimethyl-8-ribityllumazine synthase|uniref:6,7-dimethyl-8-ribityllumazine synthase n=1 Tax=Raoultella terrigena TaxID=577 RepID=A0AAP9XT65_RAOTE|nr:6,7-dimethyl-8-ribityllumazine synthase [Raoultella terrigena]MCE9897288.1 6,7-dimethyl-8-ribityllumazine synthase [Raoultella terrigena]NWK87574.1 6,7-dimethyl-8-ribityllumazine synthase [Raoultella terrigena]QPF10632.1 6,7-dimethyl-8-ribityllumazine synthase [Raoultella terrigena]ROS24244.1 6,7-dimethyl-8-ribityllumazine synthase [Raoultella terrigena]VUC79128.1 6,7-dimethyl-8-ribityllumazine synthase [Raoultella terrigena]